MSDDRVLRGKRSVFVVANPDTDSDDEAYEKHPPHTRTTRPYQPPPLPSPSPTTHSPYSDFSPLPPTSIPYGQPANGHVSSMVAEQSYTTRSNPSLSSPSGSSSPAVESTPPPSTPGQGISPEERLSGERQSGSTTEDRVDGRSQNGVPRMSMMDRVKQAFPHHHNKPTGSRQPPAPIVTNGPSYPSSASSGPITNKVLVTLTSDSENFTYLDISGSRDAAMIREKIFTKLQISDDQQPFFSVYRTEIGSYAIGNSLSDDQLMSLCKSEGDSKGSLKFLVQHTAAAVHLPVRALVQNHVPPVLPDQDNFPSPSRRARSTKSNLETLSSTSEPFPLEMPGYDGSASDILDPHERERNRNTIRAPQPPAPFPASYAAPIPPSPMNPRRVAHLELRDLSPAGLGRPASPSKILPIDVSSDRGRGYGISQQTFSPSSALFDDNNRRTHGHSSSDATPADRDRFFDNYDKPNQMPEREGRQNSRDERKQEPKRKLKGLDQSDSSKRTAEPWVLVPSPSTSKNERPSTSESSSRGGGQRSNQAQLSSPHPSAHPSDNGRYPIYSQTQYSSSRTNIPKTTGPPPLHPPPPVPPTPSHRSRPPPNVVPPNWAIKSKPSRLIGAKSMDNLRANDLSSASSLLPSSSRKGQTNLSRPSALGLKEAANASSNSFMNMDPSPSRRDPLSAGLPSSLDMKQNPSPITPAVSRSSPGQAQNQDFGQSPHSNFRPLPMHSSSGTPYLNLPGPRERRTSPDDIDRPRSVLDDIGASPSPRPFRPLPNTNQSSSWVDVATVLNGDDDRPSRPAHPYAASTPQIPRSLPSTIFGQPGQNNSKLTLSSSSSNTLADSSSSDAATIIPDSAGTARTSLSPDDAKYIPEKRDMAPQLPSAVSESPAYDGDSESVGSTLKGLDAYLLPYINNSSNQSAGESTLKPAEKIVSTKDKPLPIPRMQPPQMSSEVSTSSITSNRTTTDEGGEYDSDGYSDGDDKSLWAVSLGAKPKLEIKTETTKPPSAPAAIQFPRSSPGIPVNFPHPPPNFPPPAPPHCLPGVRLRGRKSPKESKPPRSHRDSQFIKAHEDKSTWSYRPPPEEITERLDSFFPDHDLDEEIIESAPGGSSPTTAQPASRNFQPTEKEREKEKKSKHKKSIRYVASEAKKRIDRNSKSDSSTMSAMLRRRNTKLWGSKLEEVTASQITAVPSLPPSVAESPTTQNPKPIFKWVRGELIGKGTYGRVYLALNATTGEMIAVKQVEIPRTEADKDDKRQVTVVEALKLESETLKDLDHPNIVQYLGFEQTEDFLSIFLEYVPGGSVAGCLRKFGKFDDQITRSFTGQILAGLEYLHNAGIIHRDLKADNILVDPSGICKISDFGISKRTDDINVNDVHTSMQGSIFWMAPEIVQAARTGEKHGYNGKVDIWSLGCVVLEMWAGRRPWQDTDAIAVIYELMHKKHTPPVPSDVILSREADDFRAKCFAIEPDDRPSASELRSHPYLLVRPGWTFTGFR